MTVTNKWFYVKKVSYSWFILNLVVKCKTVKINIVKMESVTFLQIALLSGLIEDTDNLKLVNWLCYMVYEICEKHWT